jgi:hypothetical protein
MPQFRAGMSEIAIREKMNRTEQDGRDRTGQNKTAWDGTGVRNGINGTGLVLKILLITAHKWQTRNNDTVSNDHERYLPFMTLHNCSYFTNYIKLFSQLYH